MPGEKLSYSQIKHTIQRGKDGDLLIVQTPTESRSFRLLGLHLPENPTPRLEVDLKHPPLGSGTITLDGGRTVRGRVYEGVDAMGRLFWQFLTSPDQVNKVNVRYVGPVIRISDLKKLSPGSFNPYLGVLGLARKTLGQRSDS